ncbi:MAG: CRISPR-associated endonuclease Cas3'', partial [Burkholderiales bacterium]
LLSSKGADSVALIRALSAPAPDAPVMLPSHVDCWAQTAPRPKPDPDITVFLHGPSRGRPEVHVVLRADLDPASPGDSWVEALSLCPPTSPEAFVVPLHVLRYWLAGQPPVDEGGDVEGGAIEADVRIGKGHRSAVVWRGRRTGVNRSFVTDDPDDIRPYDVVVVPAFSDLLGILGDVPEHKSEPTILDVGDRAFVRSRNRPCLRVHLKVLAPWKHHPAIAQLLAWASDRRDRREDEHDGEELSNLLRTVADASEPDANSDVMTNPPLPKWLRDSARALQSERKRQIASGYVLTSRVPMTPNAPVEEEAFVEEDDLTSDSGSAVPLRDHLQAVASVARRFARQCLPPDVAHVVVRAAELHDLGKADWRFQIVLNNGNELEAFRRDVLLAKSDRVSRSRAARRRARTLAHLPDAFRHELLSAQIVESVPALAGDADLELLLHLIASHHGYCRPFAPTVVDEDPSDLELSELGLVGSLSRDDRLRMLPAHQLGSGVAERFWRLTRRYGWWGLTYIEAILRLADWEASDRHERVVADLRLTESEGVA